MTDLPPTDALKGLLARATRGPWTAFDWEPPESDGQQVFGRHIGSMRDATTVAKVLGTTSGLLDGFAAPIRQADANARLIALAPTLAARVIEQDARIARLTGALIRISIEAKGTGIPNESLSVVRTVAIAALEDGQ
jgi:hypothetical protein